MSYATEQDYIALFGDTVTGFARYAFDAERIMDDMTTGVDNVRKLRAAFPTDAYSVNCVMRCACELVNTLAQIAEAEALAGYTKNETGAVVNKAIASVSSGTESISYASTGPQSAITAAAADAAKKDALLRGIVRRYLSGVVDANGVNLLYMGPYPCLGAL